ncbi:pyridoxal-phosphate dependent enzyme [Halodesulfurarchaeum sp. HSR-GB]|uniref:threonine synthase n=1 Tax=Halodesulfurarchaeum sp. HSR-GB TaxID=3074077 RepID=UPI002861B4E9|nr:pyridoxal-phosphate dependent enzyme [Halodesulfurarchaeum sp. HSR-GB]MDR5657220.1 pyridoxal-phosphate dependent enzyme [Halodesulfurarchaeum sp. HSR-GB]
MNTFGTVTGFHCRNCETTFEAEQVGGYCPSCGGALTATWDIDETGLASVTAGRSPQTMWAYEGLLPFESDAAVTMGEGGTPLVDAPKLADSVGVSQLLVKDEGQNPTGSVVDRGLSLAMTAAARTDVRAISLAAPGAAGQSAAAYAARADLDATVYLPSRAAFERKAMTNVHGAALTVVQGRLQDTENRLRSDRNALELGTPLGPFEAPFRHVAHRTIAFELLAEMDRVPDAVVVPVGTGTVLVGIYTGLVTLRENGLLAELPSLYAVQPTGCAPIVDAWEGERPIEPVTVPDTVCGELEVPEPTGSEWVLDALHASGGGAVAVPDEVILDEGLTIARESGLELAPESAAGLAGLRELVSTGEIGAESTVVAVGTGTGGADLLRSRLEARPR